MDFVFALHQGMQTKHLYLKADKRPRVKLFNPQIANRHCSKWPIRNKTDLHRWKPVSEDYFAKETISIVIYFWQKKEDILLEIEV